MKESIIQFGTGNFLRAFIGDFIDQLNKKGLYEGKIVIVKPTPRGNLETFEAQNYRYNLLIRGIKGGERFSEMKEITSLSRCVNPYEDYDAYLALARNPDFRFIISNTTEAGIAFDGSYSFDDKPALSYPGKLTQLLYERFKSGLEGFIILPCELIDKNADELKKCVLQYADIWNLGNGFVSWINNENTFSNTLVDRIVTGYPKDEAEDICKEIGYDDKLLDTAEPYHLWAVEGDFENELPLKDAGINVVWTDDISPLKKRKVRLLNGAHTVMVFPALLYGIDTVGQCLENDDVSAFLRYYLYNIALPILGDNDENRAFADAVCERFSNPFIQHRLMSIALNSVSKFSVRVMPTAKDYLDTHGRYPKCAAFSLAALIYFYKTQNPTDDEKLVGFIRQSSIEEILESDIFGADLRKMKEDFLLSYEMIEKGKIKEGLSWAIT
nr:tagaturonate reductase [Clostridiales bacterium]